MSSHEALDLDDIDPYSDWIVELGEVNVEPLISDDEFVEMEREADAAEWEAEVAAYEEEEGVLGQSIEVLVENFVNLGGLAKW